MKAHLRRTRISPKKANLVAGMVRGKKVTEALALLNFMPKKGADILYKVVHSAASNAKNNFKQSIDELYVTQILVTKGPTYKRSVPISRGRVHPIRKRTSNISVEVGLVDGSVPKLPAKTKESAKQAKEVASKEEIAKEEKMKKETAKKPVAKKAVAKKAEKKVVAKSTKNTKQKEAPNKE